MCFYINPDFSEPIRATRSIRVWKRLETIKCTDNLLLSPHRAFIYARSCNYSLPPGTELEPFRMPGGTLAINEGFHAYDSLDRANDNKSHVSRNEVIVECTVPKGSVYYWNPMKGEIVSDGLKIAPIPRTRKLAKDVSFPKSNAQTFKPPKFGYFITILAAKGLVDPHHSDDHGDRQPAG